MSEIRPGRTGNEILAASRERMKAKRINGTVYSHPIGLHGHGAGPLIGLWDYQDGVARPRRRQGDPEHVVLDRAAGDDAGAGVETVSRCAWRRRRTRSSARTATSGGR